MRIYVARVSKTVLTAVIVIMAGAATQTARAQVTQPSLYERLGGTYSIATVVDDFIERLLVNSTLNANPAVKEARARVPKAELKFHVTTLVCEVSGGPCRYAGRTMKESHERLNITAADGCDGRGLQDHAEQIQRAATRTTGIDHDCWRTERHRAVVTVGRQ